MRVTEIVTSTTCDWCRVVENTTLDGPVQFVGALSSGRSLQMAPRRMDLCPLHGEIMATVSKVLKACEVVSRPDDGPDVTSRAATETGHVCVVCGNMYGPGPSARSTYVAHLRAVHGVAHTQPTTCPDCGYKNTRAQAMAMHRYRAHGYDHLADLEQLATQDKPKRGRAKSDRQPALKI